MFSRRTSHLRWKSLGLILAACLLTACQAANAPAGNAPAGNAQPVSSKAKPGYIAGKAVDTQGHGIANATIEISGVTTGSGQNTDLQVRTGADGTYSTKVPDGLYSVRAWFQRDYNGTRYSLGLYPLDNDQQRRDDSSKGIAKDFVWKLSGPMAVTALDPNDPSLHYGGSLTVFGEAPGSLSNLLKLADGVTLEITLTPDGPLIDGSAGKPITFKHQYAKGTLNFNPEGQRTFIDIPLGKYTATVKAINPDGSTKNLRAAASWRGHAAKPSDLAASAAVEFVPITVGFPGLARDVQTSSLEIMP